MRAISLITKFSYLINVIGGSYGKEVAFLCQLVCNHPDRITVLGKPNMRSIMISSHLLCGTSRVTITLWVFDIQPYLADF